MVGPEAMMAFKIIGAVVSAVGSMRQAQAQKDAANFNAAVNRNNAIAARQQAEAEQQQQERQARLRAGANRANIGGSGVSLEGSALDVLADIAAEEELARLTIIHSGEVRAVGFENNAQLDSARASNISPGMSFASSLAGNAESFASKKGSSIIRKPNNITGPELYL